MDGAINFHETDRVMPRTNMSARTKRRLDNSTANLWKRIFKEDEIQVPTSLIVLPFKLKWSHKFDRLVAPTEDCIELSEKIGENLLRMNKATARLSFWLAMKQHMMKEAFKEKLKKLIRRARTEDKKLVATEILKEIECGMSYFNICREIIEKDDIHSNAKAYIEDPFRAAIDELEQCTKTIIRCFAKGKSYFYLLDEFRWIPVSSCDHCLGNSYPLTISSNEKMIRNLFLPFMNVALVAATQIDGLAGLAKMLGLPPSRAIPSSWMNARYGLVYGGWRPSALASFASLQRMMREYKKVCSEDTASETRHGSESQHKDRSELDLLKQFYRLNDQHSSFSDMCMLSDDNGMKMWLSASELHKIVREAELVLLRRQLKMLNPERKKIDIAEEETKMMLKGGGKLLDSIRSLHTTETEWSHDTRSTTFSSSLKFNASEKTRKIIKKGKKVAKYLGTCEN